MSDRFRQVTIWVRDKIAKCNGNVTAEFVITQRIYKYSTKCVVKRRTLTLEIDSLRLVLITGVNIYIYNTGCTVTAMHDKTPDKLIIISLSMTVVGMF